MLSITTAKNFTLVIIFCAVSFTFTNCESVSSKDSKYPAKNTGNSSLEYTAPKVVGTIKTDEINESSGLVQSRCQSDVFWTHNDSGDAAFIYALNEKGEKLGTWKVADAQNKDWEDIAAIKDTSGKCFLYIGDIGNNDEDKKELTIYKVAEPNVSDSDKDSSKQNPASTESAEAINFSYPDRPHNAETLMIHPVTGEIYVLTKEPSRPSEVFKIGAKTEKIADITVPAVPYGLLTGGEISPDGKRVIICDYVAGYELKLPENAANFDEIWKQTPNRIELGDRKQGESIGYSADGTKIYAGSEKKNSPIIRIDRK
jgi:hypothetical protein